MATASDVLAAAAKFLGYKEVPTNRTIFGKWYGLDGSAWCGMFVSYVLVHAGVRVGPSSKGYAYTPAGAKWFQDQGRWGSTPKVGAVVFYKFGARIDHTGLVESFDAKGITAIEGNTDVAGGRTGGQVMRKRRAFGRSIAGYGYPDYAASSSTAHPAPQEEDDMLFIQVTPKEGKAADGDPTYTVGTKVVAVESGTFFTSLVAKHGQPLRCEFEDYAQFMLELNNKQL